MSRVKRSTQSLTSNLNLNDMMAVNSPAQAAHSALGTLRRTATIGFRQAVYGANQAARLSWYTGHYMVGRRKMGPITKPGHAPAVSKFLPLNRGRLGKSYRELLISDWQNVSDGIYKLPVEFSRPRTLRSLWRESRDYLRDTERVVQRRFENAHSEVRTEETSTSFPRYYLQNFHYQSDGWLTERSAARYDMQVETLFTGAASAMRRMALPFIRDGIGKRNPANVKYIDIACGTGCFMREVMHNWPTLKATALDLSPAYLEKTRLALSDYPQTNYRRALAEKTGLPDASFDIISCVYLFHELPPKIRRAVAQELSRIIKPGGIFVQTDTLQYGDEPGLDVLLEAFPQSFHEPYYDSYCRENLEALFADAGFRKIEQKIGFLTKSVAFEKV